MIQYLAKFYNKLFLFGKKYREDPLIRDSLWALLGNVFGKLFALIAGILVAKNLGKLHMGEYGLLKDTITSLGVISSFGLGYSMTKIVANSKSKEFGSVEDSVSAGYLFTLLSSTVLALVCTFFAKNLTVLIGGSEQIVNRVRFISVVIVLFALTNVQVSILAGLKMFREMAALNLIIGLITLVASALFTHFLSLNGALLALLVVQLVSVLYYHKMILMKVNIVWSWDYVMIARIFKFSIPVGLQELSYYTFVWILNLLLIQYGNIGEVGMYTVTMTWFSLILFVPGILRNVVLSHLSGSHQDANMHRSILIKTLLITSITTLFMSLIVLFFAEYIESYYGVTFLGLSKLIGWSVFSAFFSSVSNVYTQAYTSLGKNWEIFSIRLGREVLIILLFIYFKNAITGSGVELLCISQLIINLLFAVFVSWYYHSIVRKVHFAGHDGVDG